MTCRCYCLNGDLVKSQINLASARCFDGDRRALCRDDHLISSVLLCPVVICPVLLCSVVICCNMLCCFHYVFIMFCSNLICFCFVLFSPLLSEDANETGAMTSRLASDTAKISNVVSFHVNILFRQGREREKQTTHRACACGPIPTSIHFVGVICQPNFISNYPRGYGVCWPRTRFTSKPAPTCLKFNKNLRKRLPVLFFSLGRRGRGTDAPLYMKIWSRTCCPKLSLSFVGFGIVVEI